MTVVLTNAQARRLTLALQGLARDPSYKLTAPGLDNLICDLGFVQVDSINMVQRAHHMILFSRNQTYRPKMLDRLLERDRTLFENWTHDASVIPMRFYKYWRHRFHRQEVELHDKFCDWHQNGFEHQLEELLERVRAEGALRSRDLVGDAPRREPGWWNWHPGKTGLEYLWRTGALAVARREGFQKVYDLSERVVPPGLFEERCDKAEFIDWACRSALQRLGFASAGDISRFWDLLTIDEVKSWIGAQPAGALCEVEVAAADGGKPRRLLGRGDLGAVAESAGDAPGRLRVLNPFDPILRDRKRLKWVFGFDYRIEVFVPAEKRTYGYYIFPLLEGERLIGRMDIKADRYAGVLDVTALWFEPGVKAGAGRMARLDAELDRLRRFAGLDGVRYRDGYRKESLA